MESGTAATHNFSQVIFANIPYSYPLQTSVTCCYTLTATFQPSPKDWVGIFKVGWNTTKDYHSYVWVEKACLDAAEPPPVTKKVVFQDLPKDDTEFYQFCYVDKTGQVRGASTPFCFRNQTEQTMESTTDDDLLLIMTQEQVDQSVQEKAELTISLDQMREENETLKKALDVERGKVDSLKTQNELKDEEMRGRLKEIMDQNDQLKTTVQENLQEQERLQEEIVILMTKQLEIQQNAAEKQSISVEETLQSNKTTMTQEYKCAVMKLNQLQEEREELTAKISNQNREIAALKTKLKEGERELFKAQNSVKLLRVDLQTSEKEKERLSAELQRLQRITNNMDQVKKENQELCRRLSEQETVQSVSDEQKKSHNVHSQLQLTERLLAAKTEDLNSNKKRAESLQQELLQVTELLENIVETKKEMTQKNSKLEYLLADAHGVIAEKDGALEEKEKLVMIERHEKEELCRENQTLRNDMEGLRKMVRDLQTAHSTVFPPTTPAVTLNSPPGSVSATELHLEDTDEPESQRSENLYEAFGNTTEMEEEFLVCRHCQESFPGISQDELEQHEQSHRVCPFCTLICDSMEQSVFEDHVYGHEL
ncbi:calcium-binding and coiled-coil domain-containing protein 2-like isoform X2 [Thalassophryne amazonica]|uniref:calcium-binding and coiled-coil domain-containing protein 2-like isoform X2 n=2 Tax=Thalassophryne amazonica TaxID=390379 RepID=UPI0014721678|nr:calcium-binding and coiled-coil domain-containing protein 2-like isoform X2 [Thalassophryne amazonica]